MLQDIAVRYDELEDRLVVMVSAMESGARVRHTMWITRRVWSSARADIRKMIDMSAAVPETASPAAVQAISAVHHDALATQVVTRKERVSLPVAGPKPDLVTELRCGRRRDDKRWVLIFLRPPKPELTLNLADKTLHGVFKLLTSQEESTRWMLPALPPLNPSAAPTSSAVLH